MFLTGPEILKRWKSGEIVIDPFDPEKLNPNSYDVTLSDVIGVYEFSHGRQVIDTANLDNLHLNKYPISRIGYILRPGTLYIASTVEKIGAHKLTPMLHGKSSLGRLGLSVHVTAGFGDTVFFGQVTLEISVIYPTIVYAGMRIGQISFQETVGEIKPYEGRYQNQSGPTESRYKLEGKQA